MLLFPEAGTNVAARTGSPDHDETAVRRLRRRRLGHARQPAHGAVPARAALVLPPSSVPTDGSPPGSRRRRRTRTARCSQAMLGLDPEQVRVIAPDVGGGFGAKMLNVEELLVVWLARKLGRPVRWTETRSESMVALPHGRAQRLDFTIGGTRDGKVLAYRLESLQDSGAYPALGAFLPNLTALMASGVYAIPRIEFEGRSVVTNTTPISAFRGAGRPEATQAIERAIDTFAAELGLDPAEVRRRNFIPKDAFPYTTVDPRDLRLGRLRGRARPRAALGRLRRAARRAAASPRARAARSSSGSASPATSRSRTGSPRPSSARSRSRRTAARSSAPARSRTARATRRRSR